MKLVINKAKQAYYTDKHKKYIVTKYLYLPLCINGEIRWLETATWVRIPVLSHMFLGMSIYKWSNLMWGEGLSESDIDDIVSVYDKYRRYF